MPTISRNASTSDTYRDPDCVVEVKQSWISEWQVRPDLRVVKAEDHTSSVGWSKAVVEQPYGQHYYAGDTELDTRTASDLRGYYIRISLASTQDGEAGVLIPIWVGNVYDCTDTPDGSQSTYANSGMNVLTCFGADRQLEQKQITTSWWQYYSGYAEYEWCPNFNHVKTHTITGNRSANKVNSSYMFGSDEPWTYFDILEYILVRYAWTYTDSQQTTLDTNYPVWSITGQYDMLKQIVTPVEYHEGDSVKDAIDRVINPDIGIDWFVYPSTDGFSIHVFSLLENTESFGNYTMQPNPTQFDLDVTDNRAVDVKFEKSSTELYDHFVAVGERIRFCTSDLEYGWTAQQEENYEAVDTGDATINDMVRSSDEYRDVFQLMVVNDIINSPKCLDDGTIVYASAHQRSDVKTLDTLPLLVGVDYTVSPPVDNNESNLTPEYLPPIALANAGGGKYVPVEKLTSAELTPVSVEACENQLGLRMIASPNHVLGLGWIGLENDETNRQPEWHIASGKYTVAYETDYRIKMRASLPAAKQTGLNLTKVIQVPDAHLWILDEDTVVGVDDSGDLKRSPGTRTILRDDRDRLARVLAGVKGRYIASRTRLLLTYKYVAAFNYSLGNIIKKLVRNTVTTDIGAPITSVEWNFDAGTSSIGTGQAWTGDA